MGTPFFTTTTLLRVPNKSLVQVSTVQLILAASGRREDARGDAEEVLRGAYIFFQIDQYPRASYPQHEPQSDTTSTLNNVASNSREMQKVAFLTHSFAELVRQRRRCHLHLLLFFGGLSGDSSHLEPDHRPQPGGGLAQLRLDFVLVLGEAR